MKTMVFGAFWKIPIYWAPKIDAFVFATHQKSNTCCTFQKILLCYEFCFAMNFVALALKNIEKPLYHCKKKVTKPMHSSKDSLLPETTTKSSICHRPYKINGF